MLVPHATEVDKNRPTWSLRREWSRAFVLLLLLLLTAAVLTITGVSGVVDPLESTGKQLHRESVTLAALRDAVVAHEQAGQQLLSYSAVDRVQFVEEQEAILRQFDQAAEIFPTSNGMRAKVRAAQQSWEAGLRDYNLWGDDVYVIKGGRATDSQFFGASSDATRALLDQLEGPSLDAMDSGLSRGVVLERRLMIVMFSVFGLALAVTGYFRLRMTRDLTRPVANLHQGVLNLKAGLYDQPIAISRRDELGELAEAFNDMATTLNRQHRALSLRASHDSLTGLANRATLTERLVSSFGPGIDGRADQESLLFIDVDDFKSVNDSLGHEGGDALLVQLASRLSDCVRPYDLVARLGGDEFAMVVLEDGNGSVAVDVAQRILSMLKTPFAIGASRLVVAVSIGVAQHRQETADATQLLRQADFAMYMAKGAGKNRYQIFDAQMHDNMIESSKLQADLSLAVSGGQLFLEYQPVVDLVSGAVVGAEALVRWHHPTLGVMVPGEFISLAETTGDIEDIGGWVLKTAATDAAGWRRDIPGCRDVWVSVNLSVFQLPNPHSLAAIEGILADPAIQAGMIVLEVTETALAADVDGGLATLNLLKSLGTRIAIDDFGTGFSSLSTLTKLPADMIKIDRSFISGPGADVPSAPMLEGIRVLADKLALSLIAEGIETREQLDLLCRLGYPMGQGYFLALPMAVTALHTVLRSGHLAQISTMISPLS